MATSSEPSLEELLDRFQKLYSEQRAGCVYLIFGQKDVRADYRRPSMEYRGCNAPSASAALREALEAGIAEYGGKPAPARPKPQAARKPAPAAEDWEDLV